VPVEEDDAHKTMKLLLDKIPKNDLKKIINAYDKPEALVNRQTVLHKFAEWGNLKVCKMLMNAGAACERTNGREKTAIDLAEKYEYSKLRNFFNARTRRLKN
jgi:hypothetical protein